MARPGMGELIDELRSMCNAATNETFHGVTYWTDDQLETVLDKHRQRVFYQLIPVLFPGASSRVSDTHQWNPRNRAEMYETGVTEVYLNGSDTDLVAATTATVSEGDRLVTFDSAYGQRGAVHHVYLWVYDMNAAAADVWTKKAAHRDSYVRTKAGHHTFDLQDEKEYCERMARKYRSRIMKAHTFRTNRFRNG